MYFGPQDLSRKLERKKKQLVVWEIFEMIMLFLLKVIFNHVGDYSQIIPQLFPNHSTTQTHFFPQIIPKLLQLFGSIYGGRRPTGTTDQSNT